MNELLARISVSGRRAAWLFAAACLAVSCVLTPAAGAGDATATLTLRTNDGLVVVAPFPAEIDALRSKIQLAAPQSTSELYRKLIGSGVAASSIRVYFTEDTGTVIVPPQRTPGWQAMPLEAAVRKGVIPPLSGLETFQAYIMLNTEGFTTYLDNDLVNAKSGISILGNKDVYIVQSSTSWNDPSSIYINGKNYSKSTQGFNIAAYSPDTGKVMGQGGFSLYVTGEANDGIVRLIESQPTGTMILASVRCGPGVFVNGDVFDAFAGSGGKIVLDPEYVSSFAFIGTRGAPSGTAIEKAEISGRSEIIAFGSDYIVDTGDQASLHKAAADAAVSGAVILTGTKPGDTVYLLNK